MYLNGHVQALPPMMKETNRFVFDASISLSGTLRIHSTN